MSALVVDASVAIKWLTGEPGSEAAALLLKRPLHAPDLLCAECSNAFWKKVVRNEISIAEAEALAIALQAAALTLHSTRPLLLAATRIACALGHPAYDCFYLALAEQLGTRVVTADDRLIRAVRDRSPDDLTLLVLPLADLPEAI